MKYHWLPTWWWSKADEEQERPMRLPAFFDPSVDMPPVAGRGPEFIGGPEAYWCWNQWLVVKIPNAKEGATCPLCDKSVVFIGGVMAEQKGAGRTGDRNKE